MNVLHSSKSVEWYTPKEIIDPVRSILGQIDLDPASCEEANAIVSATVYHNKRNNGLAQPWCGLVYCNPPYSRGETDQWVDKALIEVACENARAVIMLLNATTDRVWFHKLWYWGCHVCFLYKRVRFVCVNSSGVLEKGSTPTHGNVLVLISKELGIKRNFNRVLQDTYGHCV